MPNQGKEIPNWYFVPFGRSDVIAEGVDIVPLGRAKMCTKAMYSVMNIMMGRMRPIIATYNSTVIVQAHGNTVNVNATIKEKYHRMAPLRDHFEELSNLGEVRSTQFVAMEVKDDGTLGTATWDDVNYIYLPSTDGYRPCYYHYMANQGYKVKPLSDRKLKIEWLKEGEMKP